MTTREQAADLVHRMQQCFNTRRFEQAADLHTLDFFSHPLGTTGADAGREAWRMVTARYPAMRVVAQDILIDGDKLAVRSIVEGIPVPDVSTAIGFSPGTAIGSPRRRSCCLPAGGHWFSPARCRRGS